MPGTGGHRAQWAAYEDKTFIGLTFCPPPCLSDTWIPALVNAPECGCVQVAMAAIRTLSRPAMLILLMQRAALQKSSNSRGSRSRRHLRKSSRG